MSEDAPLWKRGRPAEYHSGLPSDLIRMMALGYTNVWVCNEWNISETTFYRWLQEYEDLKEAFEIGLPKCQVWWEQFGKDMMNGEKSSDGFKPWIAFMNKKFKYNGSSESNTQGNTINIGNMNVLSTDSKENNKKLTQLMERYGALSIDDLKVKLLEHDDNKNEG